MDGNHLRSARIDFQVVMRHTTHKTSKVAFFCCPFYAEWKPRFAFPFSSLLLRFTSSSLQPEKNDARGAQAKVDGGRSFKMCQGLASHNTYYKKMSHESRAVRTFLKHVSASFTWLRGDFQAKRGHTTRSNAYDSLLDYSHAPHHFFTRNVLSVFRW